MIALEERTVETDKNFQAFEKLPPTIKSSHSGKCALLRGTRVVGHFDSAPNALGRLAIFPLSLSRSGN